METCSALTVRKTRCTKKATSNGYCTLHNNQKQAKMDFFEVIFGKDYFIAERCYSETALQEIEGKFNEFANCETEMYDLSDLIEEEIPASILVIKEAVQSFEDPTKLLTELKELHWDKKPLSFNSTDVVPFINGMLDVFSVYLGSIVEEYDISITNHKVMPKNVFSVSQKHHPIFFQVGLEKLPLNFCWFQEGKAVAEPLTIELAEGDLVLMTEKAAGYDCRKKKIYTLRHGLGEL